MHLKTPHYRIDDPNAQLAVRFIAERSTVAAAPKITARLTAPARATVFATRSHAEACFAQFLAGQPLEIVRVDEVAA